MLSRPISEIILVMCLAHGEHSVNGSCHHGWRDRLLSSSLLFGSMESGAGADLPQMQAMSCP